MKKVLFVAIFCASVSSLGCADPLNSYDIYIADGFPAKQEAQIFYALDQWERAEERFGLKFHVHYGTSSDPKGTYTVYPQTLLQLEVNVHNRYVEGRTNCADASDNHGEVYLPTDLDTAAPIPNGMTADGLFLEVVAHEFGHVLGLNHTGENTLMFWATGAAQASAITCADQKQFHDLRSGEIFFCDNGDVKFSVEESKKGFK